MLTIRTGNYSKEEMGALHEIIDEFLNILRLEYGICESGYCVDCPVRHICYDLRLANEYLVETVTGSDKRNDRR